MNLKRAVITQAGAATTELVAAPAAGSKIQVWGYTLVQASGGTAVLKSATTALTGAMPGGAPIVTGGPGPILECAAAEALNLVTTGGAAFGHLQYTVVPTAS